MLLVICSDSEAWQEVLQPFQRCTHLHTVWIDSLDCGLLTGLSRRRRINFYVPEAVETGFEIVDGSKTQNLEIWSMRRGSWSWNWDGLMRFRD